MKLPIMALMFALHVSLWAQVDENDVPLNRLSHAEKLAGWRLLWDGRTSNGWRGARLQIFPEKGWSMQHGELIVHESGGLKAGRGGDIVTTATYGAFELSLEFKLTSGANSGIKYFVFPERLKKSGSVLGLEYQLLDDEKHPDARRGANGNRTVGSLYDLIPAENKKANPTGEWNHARIIAKKNGDVEHWLNGVKVVEYNRFSQIFRTLLVHSKYKDYDDFGQIPEGHIVLQDHGNMVSFRNIKIRQLH